VNATTSTASVADVATSDAAAYLRQPTLRGDRIVFVADDDLWSVGAAGGVARRITAGLAEASTPSLSPDGRWLAFVGRDEQHPEVHAMPADGGQARRLTWLGTDVQVRGWTPAGEIVYVTTQGQPFFRNHQAFAVAPTGGPPRALGLGQVNHIAWGAGGRVAIGRNTEDPARWKRYRGGRAGAIWVDGEGSGTFRRLSELAGNVTSPMWIGERLFFIGDGEGVANLYSCRADGSDVRRHTDHDDRYARQAQSDGERIVYTCGARLWLFDPATDATRELAIATPAHRTQAARRFVAAADHLESF
jgi:tricorn protease